MKQARLREALDQFQGPFRTLSDEIVRIAELILLVGVFHYAFEISGSWAAFGVALVLFVVTSARITLGLASRLTAWIEHDSQGTWARVATGAAILALFAISLLAALALLDLRDTIIAATKN